MNKKLYIVIALILIVVVAFFFLVFSKKTNFNPAAISENIKEQVQNSNPLSIEFMRKQQYPGSDLVIEQTLDSGSNYSRYIASYKSDGLKIYGLLTVPDGEKPETGWPVIIFNHGYIQPEQYR